MKVEIRLLTAQDAQTSYHWRNDKEVWRYTNKTHHDIVTYEIERQWILSVIGKNDSLRCAIVVDSIYVGNIQITDINPDNTLSNFHIFIGDKNYWGRGIAKIAITKFLAIVYTKFPQMNIQLFVKKNHNVAIKLYSSVGFFIIDDCDDYLLMSHRS